MLIVIDGHVSAPFPNSCAVHEIYSVLYGNAGTPTAVTRRARDVDLQFTSGLPKTTAPRGIRGALEVSRHSFTHFAHSSCHGETDNE